MCVTIGILALLLTSILAALFLRSEGDLSGPIEAQLRLGRFFDDVPLMARDLGEHQDSVPCNPGSDRFICYSGQDVSYHLRMGSWRGEGLSMWSGGFAMVNARLDPVRIASVICEDLSSPSLCSRVTVTAHPSPERYCKAPSPAAEVPESDPRSCVEFWTQGLSNQTTSWVLAAADGSSTGFLGSSLSYGTTGGTVVLAAYDHGGDSMWEANSTDLTATTGESGTTHVWFEVSLNPQVMDLQALRASGVPHWKANLTIVIGP
jgi:hypothetical protein